MYVSKSEIETFMGVTIDASADVFIDMIIEGAQDYVERFCGDDLGKRVFVAPDPDNDVTRYFDTYGGIGINLPDLKELTSVTFDDTTLVEGTDFYLYPLNAITDGEPYTRIELVQPETMLNRGSRLQMTNNSVFDEGQKMITIVGKWRYSDDVPAAIKIAILKLVGAMLRENANDSDLRVITSETLGDYSVSYSSTSSIANSIGVNTSLDQFKRKLQKKLMGTIKIS